MSSLSEQFFQKAKNIIPGGVNSPVRAFKSVGLSPLFIKKASGSKIYDIEGNEYIDYVGSWGPMILGHANEQVLAAVSFACDHGTSFGAPTLVEIEIAELITSIMPSIEMIRMVNSGTEATMSAIRLARGYTGRDKIVKFEGCYHGHGDSFLIKAGSGALTLGIPDSKGVTQGVAKDTLTAQFNSIDSVKSLIRENKNQIASVIVEPICGNVGCIPPNRSFLRDLRDLCSSESIVLIFDEVMTGFRVALGGAQEIYNVKPDLTCLGKIIGGGLPVGAYGGKKEIMEHIAPAGDIYQAGTLSGNPVAMTAGLETLKILTEPGTYGTLEKKSKKLELGIAENLKKLNLKLTSNRVGSMFSLFFTDKEVIDFQSAKTSDTKKFSLYFKEMLDQGIYLAPSQFEAGFMSLAHSDDDIEKTVKANYNALKKVFS
ncbi:MAG: glutamate-1-semialdehyde 2,1-aminomutase [Spirochaetota bacterium]|nr:glutamate-1-semialdehyde 2,1-aminomutase [Spirochaetota bacterium]